MIRLAPLLLLAGCATGSLDCADLRHGACKASFQRFLTDTSATFTRPDGLSFTYSSSPNAATISQLVGLLAAERQPAEPNPPRLDPEDMFWSRSCPAIPNERLTPINYRFEAMEP